VPFTEHQNLMAAHIEDANESPLGQLENDEMQSRELKRLKTNQSVRNEGEII
jgi:hypothetical protein